MNELVALDPGVLEGKSLVDLKRDLFQINREFGFANGRFIAEFPQAYERLWSEAYQALNSIPDGLSKQEVKKRLEEFLANLLPTNADYRDGETWVNNALLQSKQYFDAVISNSDGPDLHTFEQLLSGDIAALSEAGREAKLAATSQNYSNVIRPLVLASTELFIADRYFPFIGTNSKDFEIQEAIDLLSRLIKIAEENKRCKWIVIISDFASRREFSNREKEEKIKETISAVKKSTGKNTYCSLDFELEKGNHLQVIHERYVFSMKGCISFDKGLVCDGKTRKVDYETKSSHDATLHKFRKYMKAR